MKRALLINDTSLNFHYGCQLVSKNIEKGLLENNIRITHKLYVWEKKLLSKVLNILESNSFDMVVINWEWTIHHESKYANTLISIWKKIKKHFTIPVVLLNSTIQEMGESLPLLKYFDIINVRDPFSYNYLKENNIKSILTPDHSIYTKRYPLSKQNSTLIWGSVIHKICKYNYTYAKHNKIDFIDTLYLPKGSNYNPINILKKCFYVLVKFCNFSLNTKFLILSEETHLKKLNSTYNKYITGRFHDIYISILSWLDFYVFKSNSYKIESTLEYIWLKNKIINSVDTGLQKKGFSKSEREKISNFYNNGIKDIKMLYNNLWNLIK